MAAAVLSSVLFTANACQRSGVKVERGASKAEIGRSGLDFYRMVNGDV